MNEYMEHLRGELVWEKKLTNWEDAWIQIYEYDNTRYIMGRHSSYPGGRFLVNVVVMADLRKLVCLANEAVRGDNVTC